MLKAIILTSLLLSLTLAVDSGVALGVDRSVVDNFKHYLMPTIIKTINNLTIPDAKFSDGSVKNVHFNIDQLDGDA